MSPRSDTQGLANHQCNFPFIKKIADFMFAETEKLRVLTFEISCLFNERKIALMICETLRIKNIFWRIERKLVSVSTWYVTYLQII